MKVTDYSFTNNDTEYNLIKELLREVETYPDMDNNWNPGRMDYWRYNVHAEKGVDFFQANAHYWKTEMNQVVALFISESCATAGLCSQSAAQQRLPVRRPYHADVASHPYGYCHLVLSQYCQQGRG